MTAHSVLKLHVPFLGSLLEPCWNTSEVPMGWKPLNGMKQLLMLHILSAVSFSHFCNPVPQTAPADVFEADVSSSLQQTEKREWRKYGKRRSKCGSSNNKNLTWEWAGCAAERFYQWIYIDKSDCRRGREGQQHSLYMEEGVNGEKKRGWTEAADESTELQRGRRWAAEHQHQKEASCRKYNKIRLKPEALAVLLCCAGVYVRACARVWQRLSQIVLRRLPQFIFQLIRRERHLRRGAFIGVQLCFYHLIIDTV